MSNILAPDWPDDPALFLDLDGTLLDFVLDPSQVQVPERLRSILTRLPAVTEGAIAFVSGRTLADLDRLLGKGHFPLAAVHGLERRDSQGRLLTSITNDAELDRMTEKLEQIANEFPKTLLEHKGAAIALHYRRCPEVEEHLIERVEDSLDGMASRLQLIRGNMVLEIKPGDSNKGTAIAAFMEEVPFRGRTPVFVGDDTTDEDGFRVVNELGGISVKVNSGPSSAVYRLNDKDSVIDWLDELVKRAKT